MIENHNKNEKMAAFLSHKKRMAKRAEKSARQLKPEPDFPGDERGAV